MARLAISRLARAKNQIAMLAARAPVISAKNAGFNWGEKLKKFQLNAKVIMAYNNVQTAAGQPRTNVITGSILLSFSTCINPLWSMTFLMSSRTEVTQMERV